jgi:hypothetical protein
MGRVNRLIGWMVRFDGWIDGLVRLVLTWRVDGVDG